VETSIEELCKGHPTEIKEYMEYCRKLEFTEEPDYKYIIKLFEGCMQRHNYDMKVLDYTWKQNRLKRDIDYLKQSVKNVLDKKKPDADEEEKEDKRKLDPSSFAMK